MARNYIEVNGTKISRWLANNVELSKIFANNVQIYGKDYYIWNKGVSNYEGGWTSLKNGTVGSTEISIGTDGTIRTSERISMADVNYICAWVRVRKYYDGIYDMGIWSSPPSASIPSGGYSSGFVVHVKGTSYSTNNNDKYICIVLPTGNNNESYYFVYGLRGYGSEYLDTVACDNGCDKIDISTTGDKISYVWSNDGHTLTVTRSANGGESNVTTNSFTLTAKEDVKVRLMSYSESGWDYYSVNQGFGVQNGQSLDVGDVVSTSMTGKAQGAYSICRWVFNIM